MPSVNKHIHVCAQIAVTVIAYHAPLKSAWSEAQLWRGICHIDHEQRLPGVDALTPISRDDREIRPRANTHVIIAHDVHVDADPFALASERHFRKIGTQAGRPVKQIFSRHHAWVLYVGPEFVRAGKLRCSMLGTKFLSSALSSPYT